MVLKPSRQNIAQPHGHYDRVTSCLGLNSLVSSRVHNLSSLSLQNQILPFAPLFAGFCPNIGRSHPSTMVMATDLSTLHT